MRKLMLQKRPTIYENHLHHLSTWLLLSLLVPLRSSCSSLVFFAVDEIRKCRFPSDHASFDALCQGSTVPRLSRSLGGQNPASPEGELGGMYDFVRICGTSAGLIFSFLPGQHRLKRTTVAPWQVPSFPGPRAPKPAHVALSTSLQRFSHCTWCRRMMRWELCDYDASFGRKL